MKAMLCESFPFIYLNAPTAGGIMWESLLWLFVSVAFLRLPENHTLATAAWAVTACSFHGDRQMIMGCGTPSNPLYDPDVCRR